MVRVSPRSPIKAQVSDVTASRSAGTIYQNTTGRPMLVLASFCAHRLAASDQAYLTAQIGAASPPTTTVGNPGLYHDVRISEPVESVGLQVVFAVPPGYYYRIVVTMTGTGELPITAWVEVEL